MSAAPWDTLLTGALVFDGTGAPPRREDVALAEGKIAARGEVLPREQAREVHDCRGQWLMPGLLDIHTHLDLEVEIAPGLEEVVRHGTTAVVVGNCSLGAAFGAQRSDGQDPIVDCFARVENIPKHVLAKCADRMVWSDTGEYLRHLDALALGPGIAPLIPHSMLRIQVMGLEQAISRAPTPAELDRMCELLGKAVLEGYIGFSTDGLPFHYLANDPHRDRRIPTQFADYAELKRLTGILREADRVWQATPMPDRIPETLRRFMLSSARLHGKALRVSALAAVDFVANPRGISALLGMARLINSPLMRGRFHLQALSSPFTIWADGVTNPIMEELPSTRALMALDLSDRDGRLALLSDPAWVAGFHADWYRGRRGFDAARIKMLLGLPPDNVSRSLDRFLIDSCPIRAWRGESIAGVHARLVAFQASGGSAGARDAEEKAFFADCPAPIGEAPDFFLHLLRCWDKDLRWSTVVANPDPAKVRDLLFHPHTLPGFNDSGAHLSNLAFYDGNLMTLRIAQQESTDLVAAAVRRLTQEPAEFFGIEAGSIAAGARADVVVVDPAALKAYDSDANRQLIWREDLQAQQLVNRSDGVVREVYIAGRPAWRDGAASPLLGREKLGSALTFRGRA